MVAALRLFITCSLLLPAAAIAAPLGWRVLTPVADGAAALAFDASSGRLAVGDVRGLSLGIPGEALRSVALRGPVRDLAFGGGTPGWLLAATAAGLFRIEPGGEVRSVSPAPGHAARDVLRIASVQGAVAVASADGVFVSQAGFEWQRASQRWPSGPASAVALRAVDEGFECWAIVEGQVWGVALERHPDGLRSGAARQLVLPEAPTGNGPVDIAFDIAGSDAVVLFASAFALRMPRSSEWRVLRPTLAPGARFERLAAGLGSVWLATDRGLWLAAGLEERWERAASPTGSESIGAVVGSAARLFVASETGVREALVAAAVRPVAALGERSRAAGSTQREAPAIAPRVVALPLGAAVGVDPPIAELQRAVLAYVDLEPARIRSLRTGVAERGWLPGVALRVAAGGDRDRDDDYDQAFVSGDTRHLFDRTRRRGYGVDASVTLSWDLGDLRYHPEAIDVSREAREVLKLRDDVLDEVNQLYFERRAILAQLAAEAAALAPAEAQRLRLRAAELAAGLDAWSGGWFRRARRAQAP